MLFLIYINDIRGRVENAMFKVVFSFLEGGGLGFTKLGSYLGNKVKFKHSFVKYNQKKINNVYS